MAADGTLPADIGAGSKALTVQSRLSMMPPPPQHRAMADQQHNERSGNGAAGDGHNRQLTRRKNEVNVKVPAFLNKLYKYGGWRRGDMSCGLFSDMSCMYSMVEDSDIDDLIHWSEQGLSVVGMCESLF